MLERLLITDSSQWESPEEMMAQLLSCKVFDTLMLRENWPLEVVELWVNQWQAHSRVPLILNCGWTEGYLQNDSKKDRLETLLMQVDGLHLKGDEVRQLNAVSSKVRQRYIKRLENSQKWGSLKFIGMPVHGLGDVYHLPTDIEMAYMVLSPVRASGCKVGVSPLDQNEQLRIIASLKRSDFTGKVIALGGLKHTDFKTYQAMGYDGVAGRRGFLNY